MTTETTQLTMTTSDSLTPVLVAIATLSTKLDIYIAQHSKYEDRSEANFKQVWIAIDSLKAKQDTSAGYSAGMKAMWAIIGALPAGVAALLFSRGGI